MVLIFPNLCLWRRSLRSNVRGIHSKKLYRATLIKLLFQLDKMKQNPTAVEGTSVITGAKFNKGQICKRYLYTHTGGNIPATNYGQ